MNQKIIISKEEIYKNYIVNKLSAQKIGKLYNCEKTVILSLLKKYNIKKRKQNLIIGQKIGSFTLLEPIHTLNENNKKRITHWICRCDCGKEVKETQKSICGKFSRKKCQDCFDKSKDELYSNHISKTMWHGIKGSASSRNLEFNITKEYVWNLYLKQEGKCALSGIQLKITRPINRKETTASLDRIDSSKGYVEGNVQWVHKKINFMKQALSDEEFIYLCKKVAENNE